MKPDSEAGIIYGLRVIAAVGGGFLFQLPLYAVQSTTVNEHLGIATAGITFFRSVGQAFGVAIGGTVFQNEFDRYASKGVADATIPKQYLITGAQAAGAYKVIGTFPENVVTTYRYIYADSLSKQHISVFPVLSSRFYWPALSFSSRLLLSHKNMLLIRW